MKGAVHLRERCPMERQYDLFQRQDDDFPQWIGAADTADEAKKQLEGLAQGSRGVGFFARDFCSGTVIAFARFPSEPASRGFRARAY